MNIQKICKFSLIGRNLVTKEFSCPTVIGCTGRNLPTRRPLGSKGTFSRALAIINYAQPNSAGASHHAFLPSDKKCILARDFEKGLTPNFTNSHFPFLGSTPEVQFAAQGLIKDRHVPYNPFTQILGQKVRYTTTKKTHMDIDRAKRRDSVPKSTDTAILQNRPGTSQSMSEEPQVRESTVCLSGQLAYMLSQEAETLPRYHSLYANDKLPLYVDKETKANEATQQRIMEDCFWKESEEVFWVSETALDSSVKENMAGLMSESEERWWPVTVRDNASQPPQNQLADHLPAKENSMLFNPDFAGDMYKQDWNAGKTDQYGDSGAESFDADGTTYEDFDMSYEGVQQSQETPKFNARYDMTKPVKP